MLLARQLERAAERLASVPVTGLDISDETLKFIRFEHRRERLAVAEHGSIPIRSGVLAGGEIKAPAELAAILRGGLGALKRGHQRFVIASLPEEKGFLDVIQIPRVSAMDLRDALRWELSEEVPLPLEDIYFDYEVIPQATPKDHLDVLTIAFPREIVDSYLTVFRTAGVIPLAFELESQSIARALVDRQHPALPIIILDIGRSRTSFVMMYNGSISLTSTIGFSGASLNQAIMRAFGVDASRAEAIKKEVGLRVDPEIGDVGEVLHPALSSLVSEIEKHAEYYRDHLAGRHGAEPDIAKIVCTGGDSALIGLDAYLARTIGKSVQIGDPFVTLRGRLAENVPPFPKNTALQFTTAVGLAIRDFDI